MTWTLLIPKASPSLNEFHHQHWRVANKAKQEWLMLVRAAHGFSKIIEATGRRQVILTRHARNPLDQDNLAGGAKCIIDALKHWHILKDDSDEFADLIYRNGQPATPGFTELEISDTVTPYTPGCTVAEMGEHLSKAWAKYEWLFHEVPHGTPKQMAALIELCPELRKLFKEK